ncbi:MAG: neutral/alkaline non-lysosomal ceramidase N-terminal domain-containing protein [Novipirellula sp. JB048]
MNSKRWVLATLAIVSSIFLLSTAGSSLRAADAKSVFRAGAAASNITPPLGEMIVGGWRPFPATNIHDELYARCLVLDDGNTQIAFVICDNVGIPVEVYDLAKQQIEEATGLPGTHIMMAATHTHSATTARGPCRMIRDTELTDYQRFVAHRVSDGVRRAMAQMEPARIGWGKVDEPSEVFNRRWHVSNAALLGNPFGGLDQVRMNPPRGNAALERPAGPIDPEIAFISVQSAEGRPIALLANYSLHYVGGVRSGDVSADYFGYFAKFIEQKLGARDQDIPFVGMLSNGTSGDVNNINFSEPSPRRYKAYEKMQEVAEKVASRVYEAHQAIEFHDWVPLGAAEKRLPLKVRKPTPEMTEYLAEVMEKERKNPPKRKSREAIYADRLEKLKAAPDEIPAPLQAFRIGDLGIAAIPFETFAETGLEIKDRAPTEQTFTIELANGSYGYLPTPEQHRLGGYETWLGSNFVQKDASIKIVETLMDLFQTLQLDDGAE